MTEAIKQVWSGRQESGISKKSMINLVNLLLRDTDHRITILQRGAGPDPEVYVVTTVQWRDRDSTRPLLPQLPRLLSLLETLRGTRGVPSQIYLDSLDGVSVFLPTGTHLSQIPTSSKGSVRKLMDLVEESVSHLYSTMQEVELWFWRAARRKGFSPQIVERMARKERHFDSVGLERNFHDLLRAYFSVRFRIHRSESILHVEGE
ncbi:MAG: hypothetical protein ACTSYL_08790 [Candidatus Thorarchaeota archaeon]